MAWLAYIPPGRGVPPDPLGRAVLAAFFLVLVWPLVVLVPARVRAMTLELGVICALAYLAYRGPGDFLLLLFALLALSLVARLVGRACSRVGEGLFDLGDPRPVLQRPWPPGAR